MSPVAMTASQVSVLVTCMLVLLRGERGDANADDRREARMRRRRAAEPAGQRAGLARIRRGPKTPRGAAGLPPTGVWPAQCRAPGEDGHDVAQGDAHQRR